VAQLTTIEASEDLQTLARTLADAGLDHTPQTWLSLYVDVDPREVAGMPARVQCVSAAIDLATHSAPDAAWQGLLGELEERFRAAPGEIDGARGLFIYSSDPGQATIVKLPCAVEQHVAFDRAAHVAPLVAALPGDRWCVLLVNRRSARIMLGDAGEFEELTRYRDDVEGQHRVPGTIENKVERNIDAQAERHVREALQLVDMLRGAGRWQHLLIATPDELRGVVRAQLPRESSNAFAGWMSCDVEDTPANEVADLAQAGIADYGHQRVLASLAGLQERAGRNERADLGLAPVLEALNEARVETLFVAEGYARPGIICDHGDWLTLRGAACPVHGRTMRPAADIVEAAVESAVRRGAHIVVVPRRRTGAPAGDPDAPEFQLLTSLGQVAATTRFDLDRQ
jgi:hypothetical protein